MTENDTTTPPAPDHVERELNRFLYPFGFPGQLERDFLRYHRRQFAGQMQLGMAMAICLYAAFGLLDYLLFPDVFAQVSLVRFGLVTPAASLVLLLSFRARRDHAIQLLFAGVVLISAAGVVAMATINTNTYDNHFYAIGLMLIIMATYAFIRLRLWYAIACGWTIALGYWLFSLAFKLHSLPFQLSEVFYLGTANILGLVACLMIETHIRRNYLQARLLNARAARLEVVNRKLAELSYVDDLTGLANRRQLQEGLEREWARAQRDQRPLALIIADIDYFKDYNDRFGHPAGDDCLRRVAEVFKGFARRPGDVAARYGGEEFVLILPDTGIDSATEIAEELRGRIKALGIPSASPSGAPLSISAGVSATKPASGMGDPEALLAAADGALYAAKHEGRDRVAIGRLS